MRFLLLILFVCLYLRSVEQGRYDVVIDEIMVDPSPQVGLPNVEYIELKNVSLKAVNLVGWQLVNNESIGRITANVILQPDSFLILCSSSSLTTMAAFGTCAAITNFTALNNEAGTLSLLSGTGLPIHAIKYGKTWFNNAIKENGGWSLEMIDTRKACAGNKNWKASISNTGGSPGRMNSVDGKFTDSSAPALLNAYATDSVTLFLYFDEPLDSVTLIQQATIEVGPNHEAPLQVLLVPPLYDCLRIRPLRRLIENEVLTIAISALADCSGNSVHSLSVNTGLASTVAINDIVINELLFNPKPGANDFVELYNKSSQIIDLKTLYAASRKMNGDITTPLKQTEETRLLLPRAYCVLTDDISLLAREYTLKNAGSIQQVPALPSMPDDKGSIVILNSTGQLIDELQYDEQWHFKLLDNKEGISLERISVDHATQDPVNWHSASSTSGYATPGYANSQRYEAAGSANNFKIEPVVFSPNNDGVNDFANISYQFADPGFVTTITIFNAAGVPVRFLARNVLCGKSGVFRWDGLDENQNRLSSGIYILLIECMHLSGKRTRFKKTITLARNS